jgi:hypothetical protein
LKKIKKELGYRRLSASQAMARYADY